MTDEATYAALERAAERMNARIATVHERVACPACGAPINWRCRKIAKHRTNASLIRAALKHPHRQRIYADGITLR